MGTRTDQAREQVIWARQGVADEAAGMRRSAIDAINLPAKAKDDPLRFGALTAATAFVVLGGPRRLLGRVRRAVLGAPRPKSLLPEEIDEAVEGLGRDTETVKRRLEREFADYLEERRKERERSTLTGALMGAGGTIVSAFTQRAARELAARMFAARPSRPSQEGRSDLVPPATEPKVARKRRAGP